MKNSILLTETIKEYIDWVSDYMSVSVHEGLAVHVRNHHPECLRYIEMIEEIITCPDYIGINPNIKEKSFELVKTVDCNVLVGIKLDSKNDNLFVASIYTITDSKIIHRIESGRLKIVN